MAKPVVFMFSGQGSHYYHMGRELFKKHQGFREWMMKLDAMVAKILKVSIIDILYDETKRTLEDFDTTQHTSAAIIMVEYAIARILMESGIKPDYVLGASLGEVTALILAGAVDFQEAIRHVLGCLEIFEKSCPKGKMIGILDSPARYNDVAILKERSELAAINYPEHFVVSCQAEDVKPIVDALRKENILCQPLAVSLGFHSWLLEPAEAAFRNFIKDICFTAPQIPFISCTFARQLKEIPENYYWDLFRKPVLFQQTIEELERIEAYIYIDTGPAGTLANFTKNNLSKSAKAEVFPLLTPYGFDLKGLEKIQDFFNRSR